MPPAGRLALAVSAAFLAVCVLGLLVVAGPLLLTFAVWGAGAVPHLGHPEFAAKAPEHVAPAAEMDRLFPRCKHFLSYGAGDVPLVNSVAYFGGRYQLTMQVPVSIESATKGAATAPPRFLLYEVKSFTFHPTGEVSGIRYSDQRGFGRAEWDRFVASGGDLTVLGLDPKAPPLPDFDRLGRGVGNGP